VKQRYPGTELELVVLDAGTGIIVRQAEGHAIVVEQRLDRRQTRRIINELQEATNAVLSAHAEVQSVA
jgi:hypothetical protein